MADEILDLTASMEDDTFEGETQIQTPIQKLLSFVGDPNIAMSLSDEELAEIADEVLERYEDDKESMSDWTKQVEDGIKLYSQEIVTQDLPFEGAANYKSPVLLNAVIGFGDRASLELLQQKELVKGVVIGVDDPEETRKFRSERVSTFMNWQLRWDQREWLGQQDKMIYNLALVGTTFKKTFFNAVTGKNSSVVITYPNFAVSQQAGIEDDLRCFSHIMTFTNNQIVERVRSGLWRDADLNMSPEQDQETGDQPIDAEESFIEQHSFFDLDGDGYEEPYIVTVHEQSREVVRIQPRFVEGDIFISIEELGKNLPLSQVLQQIPQIPPNAEIAKIEPINNISKYGFLPDIENRYLDIGYAHLMANLTKGINVITNTLLDAGTLANLPAGYLAKGVKKKMGTDRFRAGEFKQTDIEPSDLQNSVLPLPFKEPSLVLFKMGESLKNDTMSVSAATALSDDIGANAPASTTLALLQEKLMPSSAIIARIHRSMTREFEKMFALNGVFVDPQQYSLVLNDPNANGLQDFNATDISVAPTAEPVMSTKLQKIIQAEAEVSQIANVMETGGNGAVVMRNFYEALGVENVDLIYPEPTQDQITTQQNQQQQELDQAQEQSDLLDRQVRVQESENSINAQRAQNDTVSTIAGVFKTMSETLLNLEKAETEEVKNNLSIYTSQIGVIQQDLQLQSDNLKAIASDQFQREQAQLQRRDLEREQEDIKEQQQQAALQQQNQPQGQ